MNFRGGQQFGSLRHQLLGDLAVQVRVPASPFGNASKMPNVFGLIPMANDAVVFWLPIDESGGARQEGGDFVLFTGLASRRT